MDGCKLAKSYVEEREDSRLKKTGAGPAHSFQGPRGEPDIMGPLNQLFFIWDSNWKKYKNSNNICNSWRIISILQTKITKIKNYYYDNVSYDYLKWEPNSNDSMYNNFSVHLKKNFTSIFWCKIIKDNIKQLIKK